jgi:UDP-N-acetylglucosamine:LPS N-acetylglucosamine transferase
VDELMEAYPVFMSLSALVNIILAALIVSRVVYHRRYIRNALGVEHGSPYTNIITMCVESSSLMAIASVLFTILYFGGSAGVHFMMDIIPHIYVGGLIELNDV